MEITKNIDNSEAIAHVDDGYKDNKLELSWSVRLSKTSEKFEFQVWQLVYLHINLGRG